MPATCGKWEPHCAGLSVQRTVTTERWPLGFHWKRVRVDFINCAPATDRDRLCRVLNGEPEPTPPEVKLDDKMWRLEQLGSYATASESGYRFSTDALRQELARREAEQAATPTFSVSPGINNYHYKVRHILTENRTGPADRRKPVAANGTPTYTATHTCQTPDKGKFCPACVAHKAVLAERRKARTPPKRPKTRRNK